MNAPWKKNKTTLDKVEERVFDWLDQLKLDERVDDLKEQIKDLKLDQRAIDLKDQIASSDRFNDLKEQLASRDQLPGPTPAKSHKRRNAALIAVAGAGAGAIVLSRRNSAGKTVAPPTFAAPATPPPTGTGSPSDVPRP